MKLCFRSISASLLFLMSLPAFSADFTLTSGVTETGEYGWKWGSNNNRDSVSADFQSAGVDLQLSVTGYDVDSGSEVSVSLNGDVIGYLPKGANNGFSSSQFTLPGSDLLNGTNALVFSQARKSGWKWGVTDISIVSTTPPQNQPPIAASDAASVVAGNSITIDILANDSDPDGTIDTSSVIITGSTINGTVEVLSDGSVRYTHSGNTAVADTFTYTVNDNLDSVSNIAVVDIDISSVSNIPPVSSSDTASVNAGASVIIDVLANDSDADGVINSASVIVTQQPINGAVVVQSDGTVEYTHNGSTATTDSFTYTVKDNLGSSSNNASVNVNVISTPVSDSDFTLIPGVAITGQYGWKWGTNSNRDNVLADFENIGSDLLLSVVGYDVNSNTEISVSLNGQLLGYLTSGRKNSLNNATTFTIAAELLVPGVNRLEFAQARRVGSKWGVTNISITAVTPPPVNQNPIAFNDSATVNTGEVRAINVIANDTDSDGTVVGASVVITVQPANGTAVARDDGSVLYTHDGSDTTSDVFSYTVNDDDTDTSNVAQVSVTITSIPNMTPVANNDTATVNAGGARVISVIANDTDSDGTVVGTSVVVTSQPANGTAVARDDGSVLYTHNGSNTTSDVFSYTVNDNDADTSNVAQVNVTITSIPNMAPVANNDTATVNVGQTQAISVVANDTDSDGSIDFTSVAITTAPANGTAELQANGTVLYTHTGGVATNDMFSYTVNDNDGATSSVAVVSIIIVPDVNTGALTAFHSNGQTFLTWDETDPMDGYHVYRHSAPINSGNLSSATLVTNRWGPLDNNTSVNTYGGPNVASHFVIEDLGAPLDDDTGLFVYTTQVGDVSSAYYAVTPVRNGVELTSLPIATVVSVFESVSQPRDILTVSVNQGKGRIYTQYMDYSQWNPTFNGYAYNYSVALPAQYNPNQTYPLLVQPHAYYESFKFEQQSEFNWEVIQLFPHDPGPLLGVVHSWWYGYAADHNYLTDGSIPLSGKVENFTEQRVMRSVDELLLNSDFNIDEKLIHAYGNSMGASAVMSWSMRYGSILSGAYASQPMTNYASSPVFQDELVQLWGVQSDNLPIVNRGPHSEDIVFYGAVQEVGVWDWMDHHQQLVTRRGDNFAYLMTSHGKQDTIIDWQTQGKQTVQALTDANAGFSAVYNGNSGHTWAGFDSVVVPLFGFGYDNDFQWKYPLDLSFPAIQNATGSSSPVPMDTGDDAYNLNIEWATPHTPFDTSIIDQPNRYEITLRSTSVQQSADITPRRTQQFNVNAGDQCSWTTTNRNTSQLAESGVVTADLDSLVTVTDVSITTGVGTRLIIDCS